MASLPIANAHARFPISFFGFAHNTPMGKGIRIIDGISNWIRHHVGPDADNRADDESADNDENTTGADKSTTETDESDETDSEYDSPACCSASGNSDVTVFDP